MLINATDFYRAQKQAEAEAYKTRVEAEASYIAETKKAEANYIVATKEAEALKIRQVKEAEGLTAMARAYGNLATAFGGPDGLIKYMMIEKGVYSELAHANAEAVHGMAPKMTIWNTGSDAGKGADAAAAVRNTYQMLPPLMQTINEQTGITLPEWQFGKLAPQVKAVNGVASDTNGAGEL